MTAAVYVVGGNRDHEELRYSLRSLAANVPDVTQVWVVGVVPEWVRGVRRLPLQPLLEKFANQRQSLTALVNLRGAPREFYLMNEDHYVVEPVVGRLPTFHLGPAGVWLDEHWRDKNTWFRAVRNTVDWVRERSPIDVDDDIPLYEAHTPLLFSRVALARALAEYPEDRSLAVGSMYVLAGTGGVGTDAGNAKCKADDRLAAKLAQPMPYLSGNADSFAGAVGDHVRALFPDPCRWEG